MIVGTITATFLLPAQKTGSDSSYELTVIAISVLVNCMPKEKYKTTKEINKIVRWRAHIPGRKLPGPV